MQGLTLAVTYMAFLAAGLAVAIGVGLLTDQVNAPISLLVFFAGAAIAATTAWPLAVRVTRPAV
jgi:hypothetical protein